jgi:hypothetical protein
MDGANGSDSASRFFEGFAINKPEHRGVRARGAKSKHVTQLQNLAEGAAVSTDRAAVDSD